MSRKWVWLIAGSLLALAACKPLAGNGGEQDATLPSLQRTPDLSMNEVVLDHFDHTGHLTHQIRVSQWHKDFDTDAAFLTSPSIMSRLDDGTIWRAQSGEGELRLNSNSGELLETVMLSKQVKLRRELSGDTAWELLTETLEIDPNRQVACTDAPVTVIQNGVTTTALGMTLNLKDTQLTLNESVRTQYDKQSSAIH